MPKKPLGVLNRISGVYSGAIRAGISKKAGKLDLAYLFLPDCYSSAGVFTKSAFAAPCIEQCREVLKSGLPRALIVNSGNANAATGSLGLKNARETARLAGQLLGISAREVSVSSTGVIGVQLPMDKIRNSLPELLAVKKGSRRKADGAAFAEAIMTTDLVPKEVFISRKIGGVTIKMAGVAKGSGMIAPNMATMLGFIVTDARVPKALFQRSLRDAADLSFNMTSVDTDTSTNDMVLAMSTGAQRLKFTDPKIRKQFFELLRDCCIDLAKMIAKDGEGATKLVEVQVTGASSLQQARAVAKSVVDSPLVKTAIHGADPNWGRVAAAAGKVPGVRAERVDIAFAGVAVMRQGQPLPLDRDKVRKKLMGDKVVVGVGLNSGKEDATAWGCDLTKGYIDINTAYT